MDGDTSLLEPLTRMALGWGDERRRRCFCGLCKATSGAVLIAGFETTLGLYFLASALIIRERYKDNDGYAGVLAVIYFVFAGCLFVVVPLLLIGVFTRRRSLLLVHLFKDVLFLCALSAIVAIAVIGATSDGIGSLLVNVAGDGRPPNREYSDALSTATGYVIFSLLLCIFYALLQIWFFVTVLSAYKSMARETGPETVRRRATRLANLSWSSTNILKYTCTHGMQPERAVPLALVHLDSCKYSRPFDPLTF